MAQPELTYSDIDYVHFMRWADNNYETYIKQNARLKRWNRESRKYATKHRRVWTSEEDQMVAESTNVRETAKRLGRTYSACVRRRQVLRAKQ